MNETSAKPAVPVSFWVIAGLSLLWNCFGGYDYVMSRTGNMDYINAATGGHGDAFVQWMSGASMLVQIGWPVGVWASVLGSLLLLARSRHAVTAFLVSLVASVISMGTEHLGSMPAELNTGMMKIMELVVLIIIALQLWYSRRAVTKGFLG